MVPIPLRGPRELRDSPIAPEFEYLLDTPSSTAHRVNLRHPAYDRRHDLLLSFFAWDAATGGICYSFAHDACAIVADNHHEGWLTSSPTGPPLTSYAANALLPPGDYWYHLPRPDAAQDDIVDGDPYRYPIVTCFQHWEFPVTLPSAWATLAQRHSPAGVGRSSTYTSVVHSRDISCRITKHLTGTEVAHLCPESEREWFQDNAMHQYNSNTNLAFTGLLNDATNMLLLRSDLHKAFDSLLFCLYPKGEDFTVHVMEPSADIGPLYHNTRTHPINGCRTEFLYARFAYSIFPALSGFLADASTTRAVVAVKKIAGKMMRLVEEQDADAMQARAKSSRISNKRSRAALETPQAEEDGRIVQRRRINSPGPSPTPTILPSLEDEVELEAKKEGEETTTRSFIEEEYDHHHQLREQYLQKQRPPDFVPRTGFSIFDGAKDAREVLERAGVEIRDDSSEADVFEESPS